MHAKHYHSNQNEFLEYFTGFQKTYIVCKIGTKMVLQWNLRCYPLIMWQSIEIAVLFQRSTHQMLPFWLKELLTIFPVLQIYTHRSANLAEKIFEEISPFSRKTYIVWKLRQKWSFWNFEVWPTRYVTINQNFSPIPQIYTPNITILTEKNF